MLSTLNKCLRHGCLLALCLIVSTPRSVAREVPVILFAESEMTVSEVINRIESQTSYRLAFENQVLDLSRIVILPDRTLPLPRVLDILCTDAYQYMVQGNFIVIAARETVIAGPPVHRTEDRYRQTVPGEAEQRWQTRHLIGKSAPDSVVYILPEVVLPDTSRFYSSYTDPVRYIRMQESLPQWALKVNLLYGTAAVTPNLAIELRVASRSTVEIAGSWNQWRTEGSREKGNRKFNHYIIRPEYRWWSCERYNGHFFGVHAFYTQYNVSGYRVPFLFQKAYRYEGYGLGAGITYGYHLPLNYRWGLELYAGIGAAYLNYKRFDCRYCSGLIDKHSKWYVGPTRAGISLVYMIR